MTIEERLAELENKLALANSRNRWLLVGVGLCLGIGLVAWAFGQGTAEAQQADSAPKVVRAQSFELVDAKGKRYGVLTVGRDGPYLALYHEKGNECLKLGALQWGHKANAGLVVRDEKGTSCVDLVHTSNGNSVLSLAGGEALLRAHVRLAVDHGKPRLLMGHKKDNKDLNRVELSARPAIDHLGDSKLVLSDGNGESRVELVVAGQPVLFLNDEKGKSRVIAGAGDDGGSLSVYNKTENEVIQLIVDKYGNGVVGAYDREGKGRVLKPGP